MLSKLSPSEIRISGKLDLLVLKIENSPASGKSVPSSLGKYRWNGQVVSYEMG